MLQCFSRCGYEGSSTNRVNDSIPVYRSGNILARSTNWNACSWRRPRKYSIRCANVSRPTRQRGLHARYQRELSGPQGGQWWIDVNGGTYKMGKGRINNPNVTFVAKDKDWVAISN